MSKAIRISLIGALLLVLILLRAYADQLFYDPLSAFFKGEYQGQALPEMATGKLLVHTALRFWIIALITSGIVHLWFQDKSKTRLTLVILALVFLLFFSIFSIIITLNQPPLEWLFYTRRFLIQPLVLILLIPAFYYEIRASKRRA